MRHSVEKSGLDFHLLESGIHRTVRIGFPSLWASWNLGFTELPGLAFHRSGPPEIWDSQNCQDWISIALDLLKSGIHRTVRVGFPSPWTSWNLGRTELTGLYFHRSGPPGIWDSQNCRHWISIALYLLIWIHRAVRIRFPSLWTS